MGKRDRERRERIERGDELPIAPEKLRNTVVRRALELTARGDVVRELRRASTPDQISALDSLVASGRPDKLRKALMSKAPKEMDKGIRKLQDEGKTVTEEALLEEVRTTPGFLAMCEKVGLSSSWFEELAQERMEAHGL